MWIFSARRHILENRGFSPGRCRLQRIWRCLGHAIRIGDGDGEGYWRSVEWGLWAGVLRPERRGCWHGGTVFSLGLGVKGVCGGEIMGWRSVVLLS